MPSWLYCFSPLQYKKPPCYGNIKIKICFSYFVCTLSHVSVMRKCFLSSFLFFIRDTSDSECPLLFFSLQSWIWLDMCLCTGRCWNCWGPFLPAPRWFLCCCRCLETPERTRRRRMKSTQRDRPLLGCCWPRWRHAWTHTPIASGEMNNLALAFHV